MTRTPASLLQRLRLPADQAAWNQFVDLYTPLLFCWTRRFGVPASEAADLIQDVFASLVRVLPEFRYDPTRSFRAWLRTLLVNQWRVRHRRRAVVPLSADQAEQLAVPDAFEAFAEQEYRQHLVAQAFRLMQQQFEPTTWKACWEVVVADRPAAEVAAELGITPNAVYLARGRVLRRLREEFEGLLE